MRETILVDLPGGRGIALRAIDAEDDAFILDTADGVLPAVRATALVGRCVAGGEPAARALSVGDRDALLLHLRRMSFGESLDCLVSCPNATCGEPLQIALKVGDLMATPPERRDEQRVSVEAAGARYDVSFRLPTAGDLDAVAALAAADPEAGARALLERSVVRAERDGRAIEPADLPLAVDAAIGAAMAESDPQADAQIAMRCPQCGTEFTSTFDAASFLLRELDVRAALTLRDVHMLAQHYHWSESDILRMPAARRARYIELIQESRSRVRTR